MAALFGWARSHPRAALAVAAAVVLWVLASGDPSSTLALVVAVVVVVAVGRAWVRSLSKPSSRTSAGQHPSRAPRVPARSVGDDAADDAAADAAEADRRRLAELRAAERRAFSERQDANSRWQSEGTIKFESSMNHDERRLFHQMQRTEQAHEDLCSQIRELERRLS